MMSTSSDASVPELYTAGQIAALAGCPLSRVVYVLNHKGVQPTMRLGALRVYDRAGVGQVLAGLRETAARPAPNRRVKKPDPAATGNDVTA